MEYGRVPDKLLTRCVGAALVMGFAENANGLRRYPAMDVVTRTWDFMPGIFCFLLPASSRVRKAKATAVVLVAKPARQFQ